MAVQQPGESSMTDGHRNGFTLRAGMRRGFRSEVPLPTRLVSNEEFPPLPQTPAQRAVEHRILADAQRLAPRLGLSRRSFLRTTGGMATSLLAMNAVYGPFFDVLSVEAADPAAFQERTGAPVFIFDVQLHYVGAGYDPHDEEASRKGAVSKPGLLGLRKSARRLNPKLASDRGTMADLSWANMVKEVFLDSETAMGLISTPPGPYPQEAVVPPREMTHIRDEINRVTQSRRMLAHGLITPQLGQADLDFMDQQAATLKVDAWKGYTGAAPKGFDRGWFVDDEKIAYPMLERARKLGVKRVCLHKGLPLGPVADYNHPRDVIKAARDFPDIDFLLYHAGLLGVSAAKPSGEVPWTTEFCQMKKKEPGLRNIYMELGSTFGQLVTTNPTACAHLLGQVVEAFGADHVLWGTDSIWYGTPQWQIEAFRRFEIPQVLLDAHSYAPLTRAVKEQIFGANAARVFGVDVNARRNDIPQDYLSRMKMAYFDEGATPSHRWYGWITG
jgi:predicted TIM-barrel fold metal-dependent hydrolase